MRIGLRDRAGGRIESTPGMARPFAAFGSCLGLGIGPGALIVE